MRVQKMQKKLKQQQIDSILKLDYMDRYRHSIKEIVSWGIVWVLDDNGWALAGDGTTQQYLCIWPAKDYADLCANDSWKKHKAISVDLDDFLENVIPQLIVSNLSLSVLMTPLSKGTTVNVENFVNDIQLELQKY